ncbi:MAG TPA: type III pantothenate kinase [Candidatus Baltobacteraceae bacterium]|jgi:type III pantothenate kinase|nr:type III pantothenate kinase [Candidatus Baltobacteraceae bacterium]
MLLTIDVGNSDTKLAFFARDAQARPRELVRHWRVTTVQRQTADELGVCFTALFERADISHGDVRAIIIASVVPQHDRVLTEACRQYFGIDPQFFTAATQDLVAVDTERPKEVGADLIAATLGARDSFGAPLIVIGFGTATTFSAVSADGVFLGAAIAPGIQVSIDGLIARAAKLPQVALDGPSSPYGRDTTGALQAGIVYGFVGQTEGLVARLKAVLGEHTRVIATGGLAPLIASHTHAIDAVEPDLVHHGLRVYYERALT